MAAIALFLGGCGGGKTLHRPLSPGVHWDQVCHDEPVAAPLPTTLQAFRSSEAVRGLTRLRREAGLDPDTIYVRELGLSREMEGIRIRPLGGNVSRQVAEAVDSLLHATVRDGTPIPSDLPLRVLVRVNALPHLEILPPLRCEPHRAHTGPSIREAEARVVVSTLTGSRRPSRRAVQVEIQVDTTGAVSGVRVLRAATDPAVTGRAVAIARSFRFHPALLNGNPVPGAIRRTIRFPADSTAGVRGHPRMPGAGALLQPD